MKANKLSNGNLTKVIDALDRETDYGYDTTNRLTQITSPSGGATVSTFAYDLLGQTTSATDFEGRTTTYAYDTHGRLTSVNDANGKTTKYAYDSYGRLTKAGAGASGITDPTEYFYSATTGLLTKVRYTSGASTADAQYAYDADGRLTKLTDWIDGVDGLRYGYDDAGRLTTITDYDDSVLEYTYDATGNVLTMEDYHGSVTAYTYTATNQLSTLRPGPASHCEHREAISFAAGTSSSLRYPEIASSTRDVSSQ